HNMLSKTTTLLAENIRVIDRMDWGAMGWITFSTIKWKVWMLKEDGIELRQISFTPRDLGPEFNSKGDRLIYARNMEYSNSQLQNDPMLRNQYKLITLNLQGNKIDSFCRLSS